VRDRRAAPLRPAPRAEQLALPYEPPARLSDETGDAAA
jgi:hypothetical protein